MSESLSLGTLLYMYIEIFADLCLFAVVQIEIMGCVLSESLVINSILAKFKANPTVIEMLS